MNILGLFVKITDETKCFTNLNSNSDTTYMWASQWLRNKSGKNEWSKYNYLPKNGHVGEVVAKLNSNSPDESIYVIRTFGMFYVPISRTGFERINVVQIR